MFKISFIIWQELNFCCPPKNLTGLWEFAKIFGSSSVMIAPMPLANCCQSEDRYIHPTDGVLRLNSVTFQWVLSRCPCASWIIHCDDNSASFRIGWKPRNHQELLHKSQIFLGCLVLPEVLVATAYHPQQHQKKNSSQPFPLSNRLSNRVSNRLCNRAAVQASKARMQPAGPFPLSRAAAE